MVFDVSNQALEEKEIMYVKPLVSVGFKRKMTKLKVLLSGGLTFLMEKRV